MTNYPQSLDNGTSLPYPSATDDTNSPSLSSGQDNQNDALIAIETKLGTGSSTPSGTYALVSTGTGTSSWSLATPASTIVGISDTQTLTNKTIDAANNTITNLSGSDLAAGTITATQIANATITSTQIASGTIDYANLLSTIFSGQVTSYTNAGSAGGTFYYINLGGVKLLWGITADIIGGTSPTTYYVTLPSSFFTTVQSALLTVGPNNTTNQQSVTFAAGGVSATSLSINLWASTTTTAEPVNVLVIGT